MKRTFVRQRTKTLACKNPDVLRTERLDTPRLGLDPITLDDAGSLAGVFDDPAMLQFIGGAELTRDVLRTRFERMPAGSGNDEEAWLTWVVRLQGVTIGIVQATVRAAGADLAWVIGLKWQNQGLATEAARAVCEWLEGNGVTALLAHIHPDNSASHAVATRLGLRSSGKTDDDGEVVWVNDHATWPPSQSADRPEQ